MPILRGAVTFSRYRVELPKDRPFDAKRALPKGLRTRAFEPLDVRKEDNRASGFVELEDSNGVGFEVGNLFRGQHALFAFRVDTLKVPGHALKAELDKWLRAFTQENDRKPSRTEKAEAKSNLSDMLRKRTTPVSRVHDVSWNLETNRLEVFAASRKVVEEIQLALEEAFGVGLEPLVPAEQARQAGFDVESLNPTPELVGMDVTQNAEVV